MIIMDVGYQSTTIVFGRGDQIRFIKQIPLGTVHFDQALAAKLKIDPREAAQLRQRLNARSQRPSPQKEPAGDTEKMPTDPMDSGISEMTQPAPSVHRMIFYVIRNVAQTLAREVSLCMRYYSVTFRGHPIDRLMLCGGGAYEKIFRDVLTTQTGLDVQLAEPLCSVDGSGVPYAPLPFNQGCEWAVALGLGLKGWEWAYTNTLQRSRSCRLVPTS
jgi:type IV pilus assembly protein PilM